MEIMYYGHSCFMVNTAGKSILFDPFISGNPLAKGIDMDAIRPDFMLLSHGHNDHVADAPQIAKQSGCMVISMFEMASWMEKKGASAVHGMNIGGSHTFDFGKVKLTPALHSSTLQDGSPAGSPCGFVIQNEADTFYYSGDTALFSDMALIAARFSLKVAFLALGDNFTMDVEDAVHAAKLLKVSRVIGMHYDTFGIIEINHNEAIHRFAQEGMKLELMKIGSSLNI